MGFISLNKKCFCQVIVYLHFGLNFKFPQKRCITPLAANYHAFVGISITGPSVDQKLEAWYYLVPAPIPLNKPPWQRPRYGSWFRSLASALDSLRYLPLPRRLALRGLQHPDLIRAVVFLSRCARRCPFSQRILQHNAVSLSQHPLLDSLSLGLQRQILYCAADFLRPPISDRQTQFADETRTTNLSTLKQGFLQASNQGEVSHWLWGAVGGWSGS